jgi:hypothetical protein
LRINIHLAVLEGRMEGFLAAPSVFGSGARRLAKLIEAAPKERPGMPLAQEN